MAPTESSLALVAFDIDGVLVDTSGSLAKAITGLAEGLGLTDSRERVQSLWRDISVALGEVDQRTLIRLVVHELGLSATGRELSAYSAAYDQAYWSSLRPVDRAPEVLSVLRSRRIEVAALSNGTLSTQLKKLARTGLIEYFSRDLIVVRRPGDRLAKPNPHLLSRIASELGFLPCRCIYVGDRTADIVCANLAGFQSVLYDDGASKHPNSSPLLEGARLSAAGSLSLAVPTARIESLMHLLDL